MELTTLVAHSLNKLIDLGTTEHIAAEIIQTRTYARIGREQDDYLLLLPFASSIRPTDKALANISIQFGVKCRIYVGEKSSDEILTLVRLKRPKESQLQLFGDVIALLLNRIPVAVDEQIISLIDQLLELFASLSQPSVTTIVGLWGELFIIQQSNNPDFVASAWHATPEDKFDISEGNARIEVKSTRGPRRHTFSYEQVAPLPGVNIVVASLILTERSDGLNIFELLEQVLDAISSDELRSHVMMIAMKTIGSDLTDDRKIKFDPVSAAINLKYFLSEIVPKPLPPPQGVSELKFKSDLQLVADSSLMEICAMGKLFSCMLPSS
jgi:hypothetical protein